MPRASATRTTLLPTFPTPTMPIDFPFRVSPVRRIHINSAAATYSATDTELLPGALANAIPRDAR